MNLETQRRCEKSTLGIRNRQRTRAIHLPLIRKILRFLLEELLNIERYHLGIELVSPAASARLNQQRLGHPGPTDVMTFDYAEPAIANVGWRRAPPLHGEIVICVEEAVRQAALFDTSWTEELVRYAVHGVLHLLGYDDLCPVKRRRMKAKENQLVRQLAENFDLERVSAWNKNPKESSCGSGH